MATSKALQKASTVAKIVAKFTGNIGDMTDQLHTLREQKRELQAKIDAVEGEYKGVEEELLERLGREGTTAGRGTLASCSITSSVVANPVDWDKLNAWIAKTKNFQLYQRRLSDPAFRELMEMKGAVPGVEAFVKRRLNVRTL